VHAATMGDLETRLADPEHPRSRRGALARDITDWQIDIRPARVDICTAYWCSPDGRSRGWLCRGPAQRRAGRPVARHRTGAVVSADEVLPARLAGALVTSLPQLPRREDDTPPDWSAPYKAEFPRWRGWRGTRQFCVRLPGRMRGCHADDPADLASQIRPADTDTMRPSGATCGGC